MIEINEDYIYVVKNFAKHQNIKTKSKIKSEERNDIKVKKIKMEENQKDKALGINSKKSEDIKIKNEDESVENNDSGNLEIINKDVKKIETDVSKENISENSQNIGDVQLEKKKNKRQNKNKGKGIRICEADKNVGENDVGWFHEGERPLMEGEHFVKKFTLF